ncbi:MAG: cation:proton antiporter [Muribaculaceae bacterium]|nr:cation:proton antiporter [Muribaculaceae bacterium]
MELNIESLISDLAFILILGGIVTVLFKWIKQPVVLGYIVAGFLASPNFEPLPSVANEANIEFWAQIGIVVLLFSLGLEFNFRKLVNTGVSAVVTALINVIGMMCVGFAIGKLLGFSHINSIFLGGMLSMSSTTIIIKALTDLGLKQQKFASIVFAILVVEDLFAVLMMVLLSSIAVNDSVEGTELLFSIGKLVFFLIIWFLVGVFVLPSLLNKTRRFLNNETLLIVSMGLCLGMAVFSVACGFSLALGAFVMGSILAGTSYAERIERVTMPVKDLFGAVFFISVGMMVQPSTIVEYAGPILILSAVVVVGMITFGTFGMLVTGQSLKVAIQTGFSLTQIGEFSFIIASLGMSLGVLEPSIYPIVVAVSVLTTFTTPYFIKLADPFYEIVKRHLPRRLHFLIDRYSKEASSTASVERQSIWKTLIRRYLWRMVLYSIVLIAITLISLEFFMPWLATVMPDGYKYVGAAVTLAAMAPFLLALALPTSKRAGLNSSDYAGYTVPRVVMRIFRIILVLGFIVNILSSIFSLTAGFATGIALIVLILIVAGGKSRTKIGNIEDRFINNLNERELRRSGKNNSVVSDLHLAYMTVGNRCPIVGERLRNSGLRSQYGVSVSSITRGSKFIPVPRSNDRIFPGDVLGVIGTDEQIQHLLPVIEQTDDEEAAASPSAVNFGIYDVLLTEQSPLCGLNIINADIPDKYSSMVIAVERNGHFEERLDNVVFAAGDKVYFAGPRDAIISLA